MNTTRAISVSLLVLATAPCFALVSIETVSRERAEKDFGVWVRTESVGTNQIGVWLELPLKGQLRNFGSVQLEIASPEGTLVCASVSPIKRTAESAVIYFSTTPKYLSLSKLTFFVESGGWPEYGQGFEFRLTEFTK